MAEDLAADGYFGMAIDYRLAPAATFPAPQEDVVAAVLWLRTNAGRYHIDPAHIILLGSSAGAHLALMHVLSRSDQASSVSAVVALNPVLDLTDEINESAMVTQFLGEPCENNLQLCQSASPLYLASSGGRQRADVLLLHGTADRVVPFRQAEKTYNALLRRGDKVALFTAKGADHTFWSREEWYGIVLSRVKEFLQSSG